MVEKRTRRWEDWEIALIGTMPHRDLAAMLGRSLGAVKTKADYEKNKPARRLKTRNSEVRAEQARKRYHRDREFRLAMIREWRRHNRDRVRETNQRHARTKRRHQEAMELQKLAGQIMEKIQ